MQRIHSPSTRLQPNSQVSQSGQASLDSPIGSLTQAGTPLDVTSRASSMPRDSALLYPNRKPKNADSPTYLGLLKINDNTVYWAGVWIRLVKGKHVLKLRLKERRL